MHDRGNGIVLCCRIQHIFDEDAISGGRVVDKNVSNSADQFAVLDDGATGHADVK